jgi:hypothetical protein
MEETDSKVDSLVSKGDNDGSGKVPQPKARARTTMVLPTSWHPSLLSWIFRDSAEMKTPQAGFVVWSNYLIINKLMKRKRSIWQHTTWKRQPRCGTNFSKIVRKSYLEELSR